MTAQEIINLSRSQTYTNSSNLTDAQGLIYLNLVYRKVVDTINQKVGEDHFADFFTTDLVANQQEYTIPKITSGQYGVSNIDRIAVNYKDNGVDNWKMAKPLPLKTLPNDLSRYATHQPKTNPFFVVFDTGIFLCPTPTAAVVGGLRIYGTIDVVPLALSDSPVIDEKYHDVLEMGMERYIFKSQGKKADANDAENSFMTKLDETINRHQNRVMEPTVRELPNLRGLSGNMTGYGIPTVNNPFGW